MNTNARVDVDVPGVTYRLLRNDADYQHIADIVRAAHTGDGIDWIKDAATLQVEHEHRTGHDPRRDVVFAEVDGEPVGYGEAIPEKQGDVAVYYTGGRVIPQFRHRGIGRSLLRRNEARLREIAAENADAGERAFGSWILDAEAGAAQLLVSEGYVPIRYGFGMRRPTLDQLPDAALPAGLEIRPVSIDHHRAIFDADNEAFRDSWGHGEATDEDFIAMFAAPDLDTSLWRVAWDGNDVAGVVITEIPKSENQALRIARGWLHRVSVRRQWRRRGLATALIVSALAGLRDAGMNEAMLGVDSENPTGALQLYESLGFAVHDRATTYRKAW
jgi:mycothiol synthase